MNLVCRVEMLPLFEISSYERISVQCLLKLILKLHSHVLCKKAFHSFSTNKPRPNVVVEQSLNLAIRKYVSLSKTNFFGSESFMPII